MKTTFLLVHGAFAGKYAWQQLAPLLEKDGNKVLTVDLPGHGDDTTPVKAVTFESYITMVEKILSNQPGKVVLVGHSMAGVVISAVAERRPDKIEKLVYLSAYVPKNGQSLQELASKDSESLIGPNLKFTEDYSGAYLPDDITAKVFAKDCSEDVTQMILAKSKGKLEPLAAFQAKVSLTAGKFGAVHKYYIETLQDNGVGNKLQKQMILENGSFRKVYSIDCGHNAYLSKPKELAAILNGL